MSSSLRQLIDLGADYLTNPRYTPVVTRLLIVAELIFNVVIIEKVAYTEIDWVAYMQEVEGVLGGEFDYWKLKGDTGPLVYPAGFVYVYSFLYYLTSGGIDIHAAQYIFLLIYLAMMRILFGIYKEVGMPPWVLVLLCASRRIHSIFVLRLFNDCFAVLFFYLSVWLFIKNRWTMGCLWYSLAVSVKMNILLYAPALLFLLLFSQGVMGTFYHLSVCAGVQLVLGLPFLMVNPTSYILRSFDLSRVFMYQWTVNWKFVPEHIFTGKLFAASLIATHVFVLVSFASKKWWCGAQVEFELAKPRQVTPNFIVYSLFTSNFIGIIFARSLHYQFYVWYYHTLPFLLWQTEIPGFIRVFILVCIELCWNIFPARPESSVLLLMCHLTILYFLWTKKGRVLRSFRASPNGKDD